MIDVLVNNAGFGAVGPFAELDAARQVEMVQVNVAALTHLTRLLLPGMIERAITGRGRGGILNVASTAGFQPGPFMAVYYATKAYVISFTEAVHDEVAGRGVTVSCLCPGATATEFAAVAEMGQSRMFRMRTMTAARVAENRLSRIPPRQVAGRARLVELDGGLRRAVRTAETAARNRKMAEHVKKKYQIRNPKQI